MPQGEAGGGGSGDRGNAGQPDIAPVSRPLRYSGMVV